jgi:hypothetical protein
MGKLPIGDALHNAEHGRRAGIGTCLGGTAYGECRQPENDGGSETAKAVGRDFHRQWGKRGNDP